MRHFTVGIDDHQQRWLGGQPRFDPQLKILWGDWFFIEKSPPSRVSVGLKCSRTSCCAVFAVGRFTGKP
jgi:hypothetical protein